MLRNVIFDHSNAAISERKHVLLYVYDRRIEPRLTVFSVLRKSGMLASKRVLNVGW